MVAPARLQTLGLGMAQQQQAAHGFSGFLRAFSLHPTGNCR